MERVTIGKTEIPYSVRESRKVKLKQIVITPGQVEVVVPLGTCPRTVTEFVEKSKKKLFLTYEKIKERARRLDSTAPSHYMTGAKIEYRGRMMRLTVQPGAVTNIEVTYKNGFIVTLPLTGEYKDRQIKTALEKWMKERALKDAKAFSSHYAKKSGLFPAGIRVKDQKHLWGSCGKDRIINLNWKLIRFPKQILEYVVLHEICHLKYRNHSRAFWQLLASFMPEYEKFKRWLEEKVEGGRQKAELGKGKLSKPQC